MTLGRRTTASWYSIGPTPKASRRHIIRSPLFLTSVRLLAFRLPEAYQGPNDSGPCKSPSAFEDESQTMRGPCRSCSSPSGWRFRPPPIWSICLPHFTGKQYSPLLLTWERQRTGTPTYAGPFALKQQSLEMIEMKV